MKKFSLVFGLMILMTVGSKAQSFENGIKANVFGPVIGQYQFAYERAFTEHITGQLSAGFISRSSSTSINGQDIDKSNTMGVIVIPEARYYMNEAMEGLYAGAFVRYRAVTTKFDDLDGSIRDLSHEDKRNAVGGGLVVGYQFLFAENISLDVFLGGQFKSVSSSKSFVDATVSEADLSAITIKGSESSGTGVRFGVNLGIVF